MMGDLPGLRAFLKSAFTSTAASTGLHSQLPSQWAPEPAGGQAPGAQMQAAVLPVLDPKALMGDGR